MAVNEQGNKNMDLIEIIREHDAAVIVLTMARLDAAVAPAFKQAVVQVIESGERRLLLDLEQVKFLDSSGLGAMVSILKALGPQGAIAVCNARGAVNTLFHLTRMDKVFTIVASRADGLARLGK